jgi:hypothetical protein
MVVHGRVIGIDMRYAIVFLLLLVSCKNVPAHEEENLTSSTQFNWLVGEWQRINEEDGKTTFENWEITASQSLTGHGYTLQAGDTVFQERLAIERMAPPHDQSTEKYILKVTGVNEEPTLFSIDTYTDSGFTAVNPDNEFPTHITYAMVNDTLKAHVRNSDFAITFDFVKQ